MRCEHTQRGKTAYKLSQIADIPYDVTSLNDANVTVKIDSDIARVSRDRIVSSSVSSTGTPCVLYNASQALGCYGPNYSTASAKI